MARKIRRATANTVATRRELRRRQWNRAEARGHRDHADTLTRTVGYATTGALNADGTYATFGLPYTVAD